MPTRTSSGTQLAVRGEDNTWLTFLRFYGIRDGEHRIRCLSRGIDGAIRLLGIAHRVVWHLNW
jgi:hypothetical protein